MAFFGSYMGVANHLLTGIYNPPSMPLYLQFLTSTSHMVAGRDRKELVEVGCNGEALCNGSGG